MQTARALSAAIGGVAGYNGYHQLMTWDAASNARARAFDLRPEQVRDLLGARFERELAEDLRAFQRGIRARRRWRRPAVRVR